MKTHHFRLLRNAGWATLLLLPWLAVSDGLPWQDSDGDGASDASEYFLGTDAQDRDSVFVLKAVQRLAGPDRMRLQWPSLAGRTYQVERSADAGAKIWQPVSSHLGTGSVLSTEVPVSSGDVRQFYRVATAYNTALPPWVGPVAGHGGEVTQPGIITLRLAAWHPLGVQSVTFLRGNRLLGMGMPAGEGMWEFAWNVDVADNGDDPVTVEVRAADSLTVSEDLPQVVNIALAPQPAYLASHLDQFALLDAHGKPKFNSVVRADATGNLPPCEFRPTGFSLNGNLATVGIRLPQGGRITGAAGSEVLEFNRSLLVSGTKSPVQIRGNPESSAAKTLVLGPVPVSVLLALYGLPAESGLPVSLLGRFEAVLEAGVFAPEGLQSPRFSLAEGSLPFGGKLGGLEGATLELGDQGSLYLPVAGDFPLSQAGGPDAMLKIPAAQPAWVRLGFDGSLQLQGKAALEFAGGPQFGVGLVLMDPLLGLEVQAGGLHAAVTGSWLRPHLAAAETVNAGTAASVPALDSATRLLGAKAVVFERYAASFLPAAVQGAPRGDAGSGTTPLQVIGLNRLAGASGEPVSASALKQALDHAARSAAAGQDVLATARRWLDLERLRLGGLTPSELTAARDEARAALKRKLESAGTPLSLVELNRVLAVGLERWQVAQTVNAPFDHDGLLASFEAAIHTALGSFARSLGVESGALNAVSPAVGTRDRFVVYEDLAALVQVQKTAQLTGITIGPQARLAELLAQLGLKLESTLRAALTAAEQAGDEMAFRDALAEYLFLIQQSQAGVFEGANLNLLSVSGLAARCGQLAQLVASQPRPLRPVAKRFLEVERLGRILDSVPASVSFPAAPVQRAYDGLRDSLAAAFPALGSASREELLHMLLAGNAGARVRDRMGLPAGSPAWEDASQLAVVTDALAQKCRAEDDAVLLWRGTKSLLENADRLTQVADQGRRKLYLLEVQKLVTALRETALARQASAPPVAADAVLAGGVAVDEAAGGLLYNAAEKTLSGWASGKVRLPGMGAALTLSSASFFTGGSFDLEAYGSTPLPPGPDGVARFSVTPRRPLRFSWQRPDRFSLAGGGKLEVNGAVFEAWASLDDPEYVFGASASGLEFDLADSIKVMVPTFPAAGAFPVAVQRDLNGYLAVVAESFEKLSQDLSLPSFRSPGEAPEFSLPFDQGPFTAAEAAINTVLKDVLTQNLGRDYHATFAALHANMDSIIGHLQRRSAGQECNTEAGFNEAVRALRLITQAEKALEAHPAPSQIEPLRTEIQRLRQQMRPLLACIGTLPPNGTVEDENKRLQAILEFGTSGPEDVSRIIDTVVQSLPQRLTALGVDPGTGAPATGTALADQAGDKAKAQAHNLVLRQFILQMVNIDTVPGKPGASAGQVMANATTHLMASGWNSYIEEGRRLLRTRPAVPPDGFLQPDDPRVKDVREYGRALRKWMDSFNVYEKSSQAAGAQARQGNVRHVSGPDRPWTTALDEVAEVLMPLLIRELDGDRTYPGYAPYRVMVRQQLPGMATANEFESRPVMEGLLGLDEPYTLARAQGRGRLNFGEPPAPDPVTRPDAYAAWREARAVTLGVPSAWLVLPDSAFAGWVVQLQTDVAAYVLNPSLDGGLALAARIRNTMVVLERSGNTSLAGDLKVRLADLDAAFKALVIARKAWWHLHEYTSLFVEGAEAWGTQTAGTLGAFLAGQGYQGLVTGGQLLGDLKSLLPAARPLDLSLPGDLRIDHVFGEVRYNHATGALSGQFGGKLSFPGIDASFTLANASLDNLGNLSLSAAIQGPLPGFEGVTLDGTLSLAGRFGLGSPGQPPLTLQQMAVTGTGTATLPGGESFQGSLAYNTATRVLEMTAAGNQLDLSVGDHLVLLNGQAGLRFGGVGAGAYPSSGRFDFGGTFGLFRKSSPPAGQPLTPDHFHLSAVQALARMEVTASAITVSLPQGQLRLPAMFHSPPVPPAVEPQAAEVAINPASPPMMVCQLGGPDANGLRPLTEVRFSGGVTFSHVGLSLPDFADAGGREFAGSLDFGNLTLSATGAVPAVQAPKLTVHNGFVFFPHPLEEERIEVQASNIQWKLDGFPTGTLGLATDVDLFDAGGMRLTLLGAAGAQTTGIEILAPAAAGALPSVRLFGQLRALLDTTLLAREGAPLEGIPSGQFGALAGGQLTIRAPVGNALPVVDFALGDVGILGNFRLGGGGGVRVTGLTAGQPASITLSGLGNLFNLADVPGRQFIVTLNGKIVQEGLPGFGLGNAKFVFFSPSQPPRFVPDTLVYDGSSWTGAQQLMMELRNATLRFVNGSLPLDQLLHPQNLEITSTFRMGFPSVAEAVIGGGADDVKVTFTEQGEPRLQNLDGIELVLDPGLDFPPIEELGGSLYVSGFGDPASLMLVGRIGGSMNGYKMKFMAAFRPTGPLGLAMDFNAGSAGIPLGPTGFLFTGAGGGVSFLNTNADPGDVRSYVREEGGKFKARTDPPPPPATMTWTSFKNLRNKLVSQAPVFPPLGTGPPLSVIAPGTFPANDPIGCPVNIPPASANILGMPHPDQTAFPGKYILKFSSIPEDTLNKPVANGGMGITREWIEGLGQSGAALAVTAADRIRNQVDALAPDVPAVLGTGAQAAMNQLLDELELGLAGLFTSAIQSLPVNATSAQIYAAIRDKAYAGVPVQDATVVVKGVFTHAAVSSFMNVEGGGTIGTTGSAGVTGQVNFLGLPVGQAKLFLSATDANGNPNPQLTGDVSMALGPLEIGSTKAVLKAEGAVTGLAAVTGQIANTLGQAVTEEMLGSVNPDFSGMSLAQAEAAVVNGVPGPQQAVRLTAFRAAFMAQVLRKPPGSLPDALLGQIASLVDQVNPELVICSDASIKLAGLKLSNGLANFKFRMRKTGREAYFDIAPAGFIGYGTPIAALTSGIDRASMAYAETFPDATGLFKRLLNGKLSSPAALAAEGREQVATMLENSTITGSYELNPLGMSLFRAQARLINPDFTAHPVVRNNNAGSADNWDRPGTGNAQDMPTREALLLRTVEENVLGDVFWKGKGEDLAVLFKGDPALDGKTLTHDYFPHGGVAVAAMLNMPRIFASLPRTEMATLMNGSAEPLLRLEALRTIMRDYFGSTVRQGNFMAYVPFPNPPALFQGNGSPVVSPALDPRALVDSLKTFDPSAAYPASLWDLGESFAFLNLDGQILDIPIGTANLTAVGANAQTGAPAMFSGQVNFQSGSWAALLYGPLQVNAKVTGQSRPVKRTLAEALAALQALDVYGPTPNETQVKNAIQGLATTAADVLAQDLPRVELTATTSTFTPPGGWGWAGKLLPAGSFSLSVYSPEFLASLPANPTDQQRLQKTGGMAMEGAVRLGNLVTANAQVLIEPPTVARPRPRAVANLSGKTLNLPAPLGTLGGASLTLDTEAGTFFTASGTLQAPVSLASQLGWPVTVPAGATVTVSNHTASFVFTSGTASATVTADYSNPLAPVFSFSGQLQFDPLVTGLISIQPQAGTGSKLLVTVNGSSGVLTNARVQIGGAFSRTANLPSLTVDTSLNFLPASITAPLNGVTIGGFATSGLTWKVRRNGGLLSIEEVQCNISLAALGTSFSANASSSVGSDGSYSIQGSTAGGGSFSNMPVSSISGGAAVAFTPSGMTLTGTVSGGLLATGLVPGTTSAANVSLVLSTTAVTSISGSITVSAASLGGIEIRPSSGTTFVLGLGNSGISVPAGRLFFTPWSSSTAVASTPGFNVPGMNATLPATLLTQSTGISGSFGGFTLSNLTFALQRTASSPMTYRLVNVGFSAPLPSGFPAGSFSISGGSLDGFSQAVSLPLTGLPALTVGRFTLGNGSGTPVLTAGGIQLPSPQISCANLWSGGIAIPGGALTVPAGGSLSVPSFSAGSLAPTVGAFNGFTLGGASFGISKTGSSMSLSGFAATLAVPGFSSSLGLSGSVSHTGDISFSSSLPQLVAGKLVFKGAGGGSVPATFSTASGLSLTVGNLDVTGVFDAAAALASNVSFSIPASATADATFGSFNITPSLRGYPLGTSSVTLQRAGGVMRLSVTASSLQLPAMGAMAGFAGSIGADGTVTLSVSPNNMVFYGFPVVGGLDLSNNTGSWATLLGGYNPTAWWKMDELTGTGLANASKLGSTHNGSTTSTATRPQLQQAGGFQDGSAVCMRFDGTDDFYSIADHANLEGDNAMSVALWFKVNEFTAGKSFHTLIAKGDNSWRLAQDGSNNYLSFDTNSATSQHALRASGVAVNDGRWHHVVATFDGSTKRLYLDGVLRASENWSGPIQQNSYPVTIGSNAQMANRNWNGWIDEPAFWRSALTPARIHAMYNRGNGLALNFNAYVNLHGPGFALAPMRPSFSGQITSGGEFELNVSDYSAGMLGFSFTDVDLTFQRRLLPSSTATVSGAATCDLPAAVTAFVSDPRFQASFTHNTGTSTTTASLSATNFASSFYGFPADGGFDLSLSGTVASSVNMQWSNFRFGGVLRNLFASGTSPALQGWFKPNGTFDMTSVPQPEMNFNGFKSPAGSAAFTFGKLTASAGAELYLGADVEFVVAGHKLGNGGFNGSVASNGSFSLEGNVSLKFGGYSVDAFNARLNSTGTALTPFSGVTPNMNFGDGSGHVDVPMGSFGLTSSGLTATMSRTGQSTGWNNRLVVSGVTWVRDKYDWSVSLAFNPAANSLTGSVSGNFTLEVLPAAPKPPGAQTSFTYSASTGIGDGGGFTANSTTTGVGGFRVPSWTPPSDPGWSGFNFNSFGFNLW